LQSGARARETCLVCAIKKAGWPLVVWSCLLFRPDRLWPLRTGRIARDRHAVLPLDDSQIGVNAPAVLVELDAAAGKIFRRTLARVHGADCFGDLRAFGGAGLLQRAFEDPHVAVSRQ